MSKLTKDDVLHVATLAKMNLSKAEITKYLGQLSKVIEYVSELSEVDTGNVEPTTQTTGLENVLRSDEINMSQVLPTQSALAGSEKVKNDFFEVKAVLIGKGKK